MGALMQTFEGGADGATIDWDSTDATGDPVWQAGSGTATFTTTNPIHGTTSAQIRNNTGSNSAPLVLNLPAGVKEIHAQAYLRVPASRPGSLGVLYLSSQNDGITLYMQADGALFVECWHERIGVTSPAGTLPAVGAPIRVAVRGAVSTSTTVRAAVFSGDSTTPLWEMSGAVPNIAAADTFDNVQFGLVNSSDGNVATTLVMDSIRAEDGTSAASSWLPPEDGFKHQVWVRTATQWVNLGTRKTAAAT